MHSHGVGGFDVPMGHCWFLNVMPTLELKAYQGQKHPGYTKGLKPTRPRKAQSWDGEVGAQGSQMEGEAWTHIEAQLSGLRPF